jgi:hypothetical protein
MAIYEKGSAINEYDLILFGSVSGKSTSNVSGVPIIGITLGSPNKLYVSQ